MKTLQEIDKELNAIVKETHPLATILAGVAQTLIITKGSIGTNEAAKLDGLLFISSFLDKLSDAFLAEAQTLPGGIKKIEEAFGTPIPQQDT